VSAISATARARIVLALTPLLVPVSLLWWLVCAFGAAGQAWWETFSLGARDTFRFWYRDVYRPARYGSVWDDVDATGRPKSWSVRRP
jgi:hypothetical protein